VLLAGDLQHCRNCLVVIFQNVTHIVRNMLVDKNNSNIIPLGKRFQSILDDLGLCILLHCEKVARIRRSVADSGEEESGDGVLQYFQGVHCEICKA